MWHLRLLIWHLRCNRLQGTPMLCWYLGHTSEKWQERRTPTWCSHVLYRGMNSKSCLILTLMPFLVQINQLFIQWQVWRMVSIFVVICFPTEATIMPILFSLRFYPLHVTDIKECTWEVRCVYELSYLASIM